MIKSGKGQLKFELDSKLYIRLKVRTKDEETGKWNRKYFSTGIKLKKKSDWNNKGKVKSTERNYLTLNIELDKFLENWKKERAVKEKIIEQEQNKPSFLKYFYAYQNNIKNYGTKTKLKSVYSWLGKYKDHLAENDLSKKIDDIYMDDINREFARNFKLFLESSKNQYGKKSSQKSTDKYFQIFRRVCNYIESEDKYVFPANTFKGINLVETDGSQKGRLENLEYIRIKNLKKENILIEFHDEKKIFENIDSIMRVRNMFVLQIQFGGLRISDFLMLKWQNFFGYSTAELPGHALALTYVAHKTKLEMMTLIADVSIPFLAPFVFEEFERRNYFGMPDVYQVRIEKYKKELNPLGVKNLIFILADLEKSGNRLIFLSREEDNEIFKDYDALLGYDALSDDDVMARRIQSITSPINIYLKNISKYAKLNFKLSTHISRHTNAQFMADNGFTAFEVMTGMGHRKLSTSQGYVKRGDGIGVSKKTKDLY